MEEFWLLHHLPVQKDDSHEIELVKEQLKRKEEVWDWDLAVIMVCELHSS